jgi:hypothetical protein
MLRKNAGGNSRPVNVIAIRGGSVQLHACDSFDVACPVWQGQGYCFKTVF